MNPALHDNTWIGCGTSLLWDGMPKAGTAIWIRTCQHIDGWTDVPKVARFRVPAPTA